MLSVPLSTCDFHVSYWQSGEFCQGLSTGSFTLLCHVLLTHAFVCSMSLVFSAWHCVHPLLSIVATGILWHAGGWHLSRKPCVFLLLILLDWFCTWWPVVLDFRQPSRTVSSSVDETPTFVDYDSTNFLKHCFVVSCLFVHVRASYLAIASSSEASICPCGDSFPCQVLLVNGNPSGSRSKIRSRKPLWKSGSSSAMNLLKDRALSRSLCSMTQITVNTSLWLPGLRSTPLRYLGRPRSLKIRLAFGSELRHHCLRCGHGLNATSFIHVNSVPFLSVWYYRFQMMKSCPVTKNMTPQEQIYLLHGSKWASTKSWSSKWWTLRRLQQSFARHPKGNTLPLLTWTVPENALRPVRLCRETQHLQLEPWTPSGKWRCLRTTTCRKVACHYFAGGVRLRWPRASHESLPRDPLRRLCSSLQQGHLLHQRRGQVHLPSWHKTGFAWSSHGRRTRMGLTRCSFTCHISSSASERAKVLHSVVSPFQQHLRQKERHCQKAHPHSSCIIIFQEVDLVAGDFNGTAWGYRGKDNISTIDEAFVYSILPTPPGPPPLWGRGSIPDSWADVCGFLKPPGSQRSWKANKHGAFSIPRKALGLRPNDQSCHHETCMASSGLRQLEQHLVQAKSAWAAHLLERTTRGMLIRESQKTYQWNHERPLALFVNVWLLTPGLFFSIFRSWLSSLSDLMKHFASLLFFSPCGVSFSRHWLSSHCMCTVCKCPMFKKKKTNTSNQRPKIQLLEQGDLLCQINNPVRVFRRSKKMSCLAATAHTSARGDLWRVVCQ